METGRLLRRAGVVDLGGAAAQEYVPARKALTLAQELLCRAASPKMFLLPVPRTGRGLPQAQRGALRDALRLRWPLIRRCAPPSPRCAERRKLHQHCSRGFCGSDASRDEPQRAQPQASDRLAPSRCSSVGRVLTRQCNETVVHCLKAIGISAWHLHVRLFASFRVGRDPHDAAMLLRQNKESLNVLE